MIERTHPKLSVGAQCQLLSISRSSFYYASQGETTLNLDLMLLIDRQFLETPFYGVRQMTWHLQNEGHTVNEKRIRRLMRLMRLMPIYQKPNTSKVSVRADCGYLAFHGSRSSMRLILWSGMRASVSVSHACGSTPFSLAVSIRV